MMCLFPLTNLLHTLNKEFVIDGIVISHLLYLAKLTDEMLAMINTVRVIFK